MGGCCCCSSRGVERNSTPAYYYQYPRALEEHLPLSSVDGAGSALSTGLLVDTNLETSVPDAYRPPPAPIPFDAGVGNPQTPPVTQEICSNKSDLSVQTVTQEICSSKSDPSVQTTPDPAQEICSNKSDLSVQTVTPEICSSKSDPSVQTTPDPAQETLVGNTQETSAKCDDLEEPECKTVTNVEIESAKKLEVDLSKSAQPVVVVIEEDVCPTCLEEYDAENPRIITKCEHHFHLACIFEWMERSDTCPVCNQEMIVELPIDY